MKLMQESPSAIIIPTEEARSDEGNAGFTDAGNIRSRFLQLRVSRNRERFTIHFREYQNTPQY